LWKLKPATGGAIDAIADYPRTRYHEIRALKKKPVFIRAKFETPADVRAKLSDLLHLDPNLVVNVIVSRDFDGEYGVEYPAAPPDRSIQPSAVSTLLDSASTDVTTASISDDEQALKDSIDEALQVARDEMSTAASPIGSEAFTALLAGLRKVSLKNLPPHSVVGARFAQLVQAVAALAPTTAEIAAAKKLVVESIPSFVYYSNYGNLDSEIYLPHVIENLKRKDLGQKEQAKARTLKVLFDFVKLSAEEIQEMGQDVAAQPGPVTAEQQAQIEGIAKKKKERDILLQSASTELTRRFRGWWKQGDYRFRFAADGNHFRIWVSDDKRPEDIELESRSTGLQWFFSFYLIFLVESEDSHQDAILLLDEPGLSLHPLAQGDLSKFFEGLAETNQLLYTTHSPFMVDADNLDRARSVYTDGSGLTIVSPDLRAPVEKSDQAKSVYAAYAALRMSVSETMLIGCQAVIVEGPSDQHYLSTIKNYLIGRGYFQPSRDHLGAISMFGYLDLFNPRRLSGQGHDPVLHAIQIANQRRICHSRRRGVREVFNRNH
jgi:hypothetical protein